MRWSAISRSRTSIRDRGFPNKRLVYPGKVYLETERSMNARGSGKPGELNGIERDAALII